MRCRDAQTSASKSWSQRYQECECIGGMEPDAFLVEQLPHLPAGRALDLAMGEGRNAVWLARQGYRVLGVERETIAIERAQRRCAQEGLSIETDQRDLSLNWDCPAQSFDVIVVTHYLQRDLFPKLEAALRPGGALVYQGATVEAASGPSSRFRLGVNELLTAFPSLQVRVYRELDGRACLLAFRPAVREKFTEGLAYIC